METQKTENKSNEKMSSTKIKHNDKQKAITTNNEQTKTKQATKQPTNHSNHNKNKGTNEQRMNKFG